MTQNIVIIIHAYQNPQELERCLLSLSRSRMSKHDILVVDNSFDHEKRSGNRTVIDRFDKVLSVRHADQNLWGRVVEKLPPEDKSILSSIRLGQTSWSTHHARNAGMFLSRYLFPDMTHSWNLDQDIVVSEDCSLNIDRTMMLGCTSIYGCPDMSRLEWCGFYHLYLAKKYNVITERFSDDYASHLIQNTPFETIEQILALYSDFVPVSNHAKESPVPAFIHREEFYGACYVSCRENTQRMIPHWYDNDWFFFRQTRGNRDPGDFLPVTVHHASVKKTVLSKDDLEVEEYGKIVNEVFDILKHQEECTKEQFRDIINWRFGIIDTDISANDALRDSSLSSDEANMLSLINQHLVNLKEWCNTIQLQKVLDDIRNYNDCAAIWKRAIERVDTITQERNRDAFDLIASS